jgi:hypothetical protein
MDIWDFMTIWYSLCSFGTFFRFGYHVPLKIWQPWLYITTFSMKKYPPEISTKNPYFSYRQQNYHQQEKKATA